MHYLYNHTLPNTILIAIRGLPEKHFVEAFVTQLLSNDFQIGGLAQKLEGFPPFPLAANVPNPGPWQLTDPNRGWTSPFTAWKR